MIGRWLYIDIPVLNLYEVKAKVDTGAYRSALHCDFIEQFQKEGETYLKVRITDLSGAPFSENVVLKQERTSQVKSSNGDVQERPIVLLDVIINGERYPTEFTLSNRGDMKFPILLGRRLLRGKFVVDVSLDSSDDDDSDEVD